jgi:hypothetical protein
MLKLMRTVNARGEQEIINADIFQLLPFAVFICVPYMKFLVPFASRKNLLSSTFQDNEGAGSVSILPGVPFIRIF